MEYDDWVIEEAAKRMGVSPRYVRHSAKVCNEATTAFCDLIQETQKPPIDPVLEEARERLAVKKAELGCPSEVQRVRGGYSDKLSSVLLAIDLINERNALQAELDAVKLERDEALQAARFVQPPEPKPLDAHAPLEARHKDGRVVPVEFSGFVVGDGDGDILIKQNPHVRMANEMEAYCFHPDGTHHSGEWTLRNRVQS